MVSSRANALRCSAVVVLFLLSTLMQGYSPSNSDVFETKSHEISPVSTPFGQSKTLSIGSFPDGANTNTRLSVDESEALKTLELQVESARLPTSTGFSWSESSDFSMNTVYDGMDVNATSLSLLPQEWKWDFESATFGPEWTQGGTSNWNLQTSNVITGSQSAQAGSITHNQESSLTLDVSGIPSASGSFQYEVSSESSFDYLNFCIDNTGCTRYSGYSAQWSGTQSGTHTFNIPASAQTLTWKYTKDGSVDRNQDTTWIDEIILSPTGGSGNGLGYWVSAPFGPSLLGQGEDRSFGHLYMDASIPTGSIFEWQLIDAATNSIVPGFESISETSFDLGMVDWETYPMLKMRIYMETSTGDLPSIHGIHFEGKIVEDFSNNPTGTGWQMQGVSWSNGEVSGSGTLKSPVYNVRSGFAGFESNSVLSPSASVQYTLDGGTNWVDLLPGKQWLTTPAFTVQFRVASAGSQWDIDVFEVELIRTSIPDGLRIDVGMDGVSDWSLEGEGIGRLGIQDRLKDNSLWQTRASSPSASASFSLLLPASGVEAFEFGVASPLQAMNSPFLTMSIGGQDFLSTSLPNLQSLQVIELSSNELGSLNSALSQASAEYGVEGLPMVEVTVRLGSSTTPTDVLLGGIFAPYDSALALQFGPSDAVIIALNNALQSVIPVGGSKELPLPIRMTSSGAVHMVVVQQTTQASIEPISMSVSNVSDTFTPSTDWIEVASTFDFSNLGVSNAESYVKSNGWSVALHLTGVNSQSETRCPMLSLPMSGAAVNSCLTQGNSMIWSSGGSDGSIRMVESGSLLQVNHRFQFSELWDDEESLTVSVNMLSPSGPMLPANINFGLGSSNGVENDVEVKDWSIVYDNDVRSTHDSPYLHPGESVNVEVQLGFENVPADTTPRSGSTLVRFIADGVEIQSTSVFSDGVASFPWVIPSNKESIELEVDVIPLVNQNILFAVPNKATYGFDTVDPELLGVSISEFDHVEANPATSIEFVIADRPMLPSHANAHMWRSWSDDSNLDGIMQSEEVQVRSLFVPEDRTPLQGTYVLELDTSEAYSGSYFVGWLDVADSAGNVMLNSGSFDSPLFNVQVNNDGSPQLGTSSAYWGHGDSVWIHPGESNIMHLPLLDLNGISDITHIAVNLAGNQIDPVEFNWNSENQRCTSLNIFLDIESCTFQPADSGSLFSSEGMFIVNFSLEWGFDPDVSLLRIPNVLVHDSQGQSNSISVPDLSWSFSGEVAVNSQTLEFSLDGSEVETLGTWVKPRADIGVNGELTWHRSHRAVIQSMELDIEIGENELLADSVNGSFSGILTAPLEPGSYAVFTSLHNPPNGAIDRTSTTPPAWFIVDNKAPLIVGIPSPVNEVVLVEDTWSSLDIEILISEGDRLDESSLILHWAVHPEGVGISSDSVVNGSEPLAVVGGRAFGDAIPCATNLNLDSMLTPSMRNDALEMRIWVSGFDQAGHEISTLSNDIDSPLSVWVLEQRIAEYSFTEPVMKPSKQIAAGETVALAVEISNSGLADGEAQMFVELVESNGARTRIDARSIEVESGGTYVYTKDWIPAREGTMWIEFQIINGPNVQTNTVYIDEASSDGVFSSVASVSPVLLVIIFLLTVSLVGLLIFGLKTPQQQMGRPQMHARKQVAPLPPKGQPRTPPSKPKTPASGPYGAPKQAASPGENPYK